MGWGASISKSKAKGKLKKEEQYIRKKPNYQDNDLPSEFIDLKRCLEDPQFRANFGDAYEDVQALENLQEMAFGRL